MKQARTDATLLTKPSTKGFGGKPGLVLAAFFALFALPWSACKKKTSSPVTQEKTTGAVPVQEPPVEVPIDAEFGALADKLYAEYLEHNPGMGVSLGFHEYDGRVVDLSEAAIAEETAWLKSSIASLVAVDAGGLSATHKLEREVLLGTLRSDLLQVEVRDSFHKNPMAYSGGLRLSGYISRDYAPLADRARAIIDVASATPKRVEQAKANLQKKMPRTWVAIAHMQTVGMASFAKKDVKEAMKELEDEGLKKELDASLAMMVASLEDFAGFLQERQKTANDDYALGEKVFLRTLKETQGVDLDLKTLQKIGEADLARNLRAIKKAAKKIDPKKSVREVIAEVLKDKPPADKVLAAATEQAGVMRQFLIDKEIVSIPSEDLAEVRESPPFMRWNFAFLSASGAFEKKKLPSFYYISPPDPEWSKKKQRDYVPGKVDLLFVTIHELWPGHFLHHLHIKPNTSRILKSFWTYSMGEGWAHYTEEMMFDEGVSDKDPRVHIGQLTNALLRNVRFLSALGLHTQGMTVEQSAKMFVEKAYADDGTAQQQAVRGTFDPMYLSYTLGKLMILKLRADYKKQKGDSYTLKAFHDEFLSYGAAPVPLIRNAMLGENSGSVL